MRLNANSISRLKILMFSRTPISIMLLFLISNLSLTKFLCSCGFSRFGENVGSLCSNLQPSSRISYRIKDICSNFYPRSWWQFMCNHGFFLLFVTKYVTNFTFVDSRFHVRTHVWPKRQLGNTHIRVRHE